MKKGFTLVELLVVVGIIALLLAVLVPRTGDALKKAEITKCHELVKQVETALVALFDQSEAWPQCLIKNNNSNRGLDENAAYPLAKYAGMSLSYDDDTKRLKGLNRFGVLTPWGTSVVKDRGSSCSASTPVPIGGTIQEHRMFYALDLDGDGIIENVSPGTTVQGLPASESKPVPKMRATAAVWCRGPRGTLIKSWTDQQTQSVK